MIVGTAQTNIISNKADVMKDDPLNWTIKEVKNCLILNIHLN